MLGAQTSKKIKCGKDMENTSPVEFGAKSSKYKCNELLPPYQHRYPWCSGKEFFYFRAHAVTAWAAHIFANHSDLAFLWISSKKAKWEASGHWAGDWDHQGLSKQTLCGRYDFAVTITCNSYLIENNLFFSDHGGIILSHLHRIWWSC